MSSPSPDFDQQLAALRAGDEAAFAALIDQLGTSMLRIARLYVSDTQAAEDVVQETWMAVLRGIERFEGRSSLKTWIFTILANRARTRAVRESRYVPLDPPDEFDGEPAAEPERFQAGAGHWLAGATPHRWDTIPEDRLLSRETVAIIQRTIESMPLSQAAVIRLRDVDGLSSAEVCNMLNLSETNQRVLLHRARARVRRALEAYFATDV